MLIKTSDSAVKWAASITSPRIVRGEIRKEKVFDSVQKKYLDFFYLDIFENNSKVPQWDYLQDELDVAVEQAREQFGIPYDAWREVKG